MFTTKHTRPNVAEKTPNLNVRWPEAKWLEDEWVTGYRTVREVLEPARLSAHLLRFTAVWPFWGVTTCLRASATLTVTAKQWHRIVVSILGDNARERSRHAVLRNFPLPHVPPGCHWPPNPPRNDHERGRTKKIQEPSDPEPSSLSGEAREAREAVPPWTTRQTSAPAGWAQKATPIASGPAQPNYLSLSIFPLSTLQPSLKDLKIGPTGEVLGGSLSQSR